MTKHNSAPFTLDRQTVDVPVAGRILGLGRSASYLAAARGEIPVIRVGGRVLVPLARLRRLLEGEE